MLSIPESHRDLLEATVATLATIGTDGRPQLSEVWFLIDDDEIRFSLNASRQKVTNLRRNPACAVLILDLANPGRYVEVRGDAHIESDANRAFADRLGAKYDQDLRTRDAPGDSRVIVTIQPTRVRTWG
jgi:PPOX class probable F420-dependent enzyme